ncbi:MULTISPECIES: hypothetical protein [Weeksellaceae]|uniref:hypothetical protein n=1 Tax=Weeksellaceae TaxID=2762318 RepID=UPI001024667E|nr:MULTISPECIES: hypothetical protein [Weeksellaceae]MYY44358.1 hypothetical protein [Elizabethkingia anophelis]UDQ54508.1 hypothetical protein LJF28_02270 [Chryseobacterium indologenes]VFA42960.1 Uncharacterised protein [Chryseobacterium indologenes]
MNYETRICCFIDILGFRKHIDDTLNDDDSDNIEKIESIKKILDMSKKLTDDEGLSKTKVITYFSDSIVISYEFSEISQLFHTLNDLLFVSFELANRGYLTRGGVSIGKLIHTDEFIFGPALVNAYELESKKAIYPRIIIDSKVIENGIKYRQDHHSQEEELDYIMKILTEDDDKNYYIDYIAKASSEFDDQETGPYKYFEKLKSFLDNFSKERDDVKIKLLWLKEKINKQIAVIHDDVEMKQGNPALYDYYKTLMPVVLLP